MESITARELESRILDIIAKFKVLKASDIYRIVKGNTLLVRNKYNINNSYSNGSNNVEMFKDRLVALEKRNVALMEFGKKDGYYISSSKRKGLITDLDAYKEFVEFLAIIISHLDYEFINNIKFINENIIELKYKDEEGSYSKIRFVNYSEHLIDERVLNNIECYDKLFVFVSSKKIKIFEDITLDMSMKTEYAVYCKNGNEIIKAIGKGQLMRLLNE